MEIVKIHEALCEPTRLRLVQVLAAGPLCVCHFQAVLGEPQVKISKHLAYLRARGLVECRREGNWMIYALPAKPSAAWRAQLDCLQASAADEPVFRRDRARLAKLAPQIAADGPCGCGPGKGSPPAVAEPMADKPGEPSGSSRRLVRRTRPTTE